MSTIEFSSAVIAKGRRYVRDHKVSATGTEGVYMVQGSRQRPYRVRTDADRVARTVGWATCNCSHGDHAPGRATCSHVVAVLIAVRDGLPLPVTQLS